MIDAYEIGIQLALQDDVSAGLQVISRGLAEVDRAIDATSAKLANLGNAAQTSKGTTATGVTMRPHAAAAVSSEPSASEPSKEGANQLRLKNDLEGAVISTVAPVSGPTEVVVGGAKSSPAPASPLQEVTSAPLLQETRAMPPSAPLPTEREGMNAAKVVQIQHLIPQMPPAEPVQSVAPPEPKKGGDNVTLEDPVPSVSSPPLGHVSPEKAGGSTLAQVAPAFTASIAQMAAAPKTPGAGERLSQPPLFRGDRSMGASVRTTAPWSGIETRVLSQRTPAAQDRPTAPQARATEGTDGLGGTVMLDGHLVGYWLAEQMAKEASRPPSGTSFFDPRQTPAWTASGSL